MNWQYMRLLRFPYFLIIFPGILLLDTEMGYSQLVSVSFESDGSVLKGRFYPAKGRGPFTTVLLLQGFPGSEGDLFGLGERIAASGMNALTFNYRGTYKSEGRFGLENTINDIQAALDYLQTSETIGAFNVDTSNIVLCGYSYGGGMGLTFAANHPEVRSIISIAGTDHGEFIREYLRNEPMAEMINDMFDRLKAPEGPARFDGHLALQELIDNKDLYDLRISATALANRDILLIGGWEDVNVTIDNHLLPFYRVLRAENAQSVRVITYHTDHYFENVREKLAEDIIEWITKKVK